MEIPPADVKPRSTFRQVKNAGPSGVLRGAVAEGLSPRGCRRGAIAEVSGIEVR